MELGAGQCPYALDGLVGGKAERPIDGECVDEDTEVLHPVRVQAGQQLGELGLGSGCAGDDGDQRSGALEPQHDVRCEQPQLLALIMGGRECARTLLLRNRPRVLAADSNADELAEQRALVLEAGVDGFLGDAGLVCDRGDARAFPAALLEQLSRRVEHSPAGFLGSTVPKCTFPAMRRSLITRMVPSLRGWSSTRCATAGVSSIRLTPTIWRGSTNSTVSAERRRSPWPTSRRSPKASACLTLAPVSAGRRVRSPRIGALL